MQEEYDHDSRTSDEGSRSGPHHRRGLGSVLLGVIVLNLAALLLVWQLDFPGADLRSAEARALGATMDASPDPLNLHPYLTSALMEQWGWTEGVGRFPTAVLGILVLLGLGASVPGRGSPVAIATLALTVPWVIASRQVDPSVVGAHLAALALLAAGSGPLAGGRGFALLLLGVLAWLLGGGPAGLVFPVATIFLHRLFTGRWRDIRSLGNHLAWVPSVALLLAVYGHAAWTDPGFMDQVWQSASRWWNDWTMWQGVDPDRAWVFLLLLPGLVFLPRGLWNGLTRSHGTLPVAWFGLGSAWVMLAPAPDPLIWMTMAVPTAWLIGDSISLQLDEGLGNAEVVLLAAGFLALGALFFFPVAWLGPDLAGPSALIRSELGREGVMVAGLLSTVVGCGVGWAWLRGREGLAVVLSFVALGGIVGAAVYSGLPRLDVARSHRGFVEEVARMAPEGKWMWLGGGLPAPEFHLGRPMATAIDGDALRGLPGAVELLVPESMREHVPNEARLRAEEGPGFFDPFPRVGLPGTWPYASERLSWWTIPGKGRHGARDGDDPRKEAPSAGTRSPVLI